MVGTRDAANQMIWVVLGIGKHVEFGTYFFVNLDGVMQDRIYRRSGRRKDDESQWCAKPCARCYYSGMRPIWVLAILINLDAPHKQLGGVDLRMEALDTFGDRVAAINYPTPGSL